MSTRPELPAGPYLVVGLARSGVAIAGLLAERGGEVIGVDAGTPDVSALEGVEVHEQSDGVALLDRARTVVKSPGVPRQAPVIAAACERGMEVTGELELAWRLLPNAFTAITGTNGKTTTAELTGAIYRAAGIPVAVAGNVGTPLASLVGKLEPGATVVAECSSFQLEDSSAFAPECAVLVNLEPDHLDRHGTFERYREAKLRIFHGNQGIAVIPRNFDGVGGPRRVVTFGGDRADLAQRDGALWWRGERLIGFDEIRLRGAHNVENASAAAAAALASGVDAHAVTAALRAFAGVPHRLEEVAEHDGVLYVNDSKATNVASTRVALEAFEGGVHLILGGREKPGGFTPLRDLVAERCLACYLIGEAADHIARDLDGTSQLLQAGTLANAVRMARERAAAGQVVLLSPACASYDQYRDFEARGDEFRALVTEND